MMNIQDISWPDLLLGYLLLVGPVFFLWYYKTGLIKQTIIAVVRMTIQLFLVGLYLGYLFELNNNWINITWVLIMILVSTYTIIARSELNLRTFAIPSILGTLLAITIVDAYFLGLSVKLENIFDARYFIAITGMILGNMMERNIIALNAFYSSLRKDKLRYEYAIISGASRKEALIPFMKEALKKSLNPQLARMMVLGIIALPGTMTGQILGGSSPEIAIKYQILLMLMIFIASSLTIVFTILLANRFVFDDYDNIKVKLDKA